MGYIYIIKNKINSYVYIGQTSRTIDIRWGEHIRCGNKGNRLKSKLYQAMHNVGVTNFYIELIESYDEDKLDEMEAYYISKYDSFNNGYNSTKGGKQYKGNNTEPEFLADLINDYGKMSGWQLCTKYNISEQYLYKLVKDIDNSKEYSGNNTNKAISIIKYDLNYNYIKQYNSIQDALNELSVKYNTNMSGYGRIKAACQNGNIAYGHRWQLASDLIHEDKIFRTKFDKEAYLNGKQAYQPEGKKYYIVDGALDSIINKQKRIDNYCIHCGKVIDKWATRCVECDEKYRDMVKLGTLNTGIICKQCNRAMPYRTNSGLCQSCENVRIKGKMPKPSKDELKTLLDKGLQKTQIAKMYQRNASTIHYWINSYGLR